MSVMARFEKADSSTSQVEYIHALYPFLDLDPIEGKMIYRICGTYL